MSPKWYHRMFAGFILRRAGWRHAVGYLWWRPGTGTVTHHAPGNIYHRDAALQWALDDRAFARELQASVDAYFATATDDEIDEAIRRAEGKSLDSPATDAVS